MHGPPPISVQESPALFHRAPREHVNVLSGSMCLRFKDSKAWCSAMCLHKRKLFRGPLILGPAPFVSDTSQSTQAQRLLAVCPYAFCLLSRCYHGEFKCEVFPVSVGATPTGPCPSTHSMDWLPKQGDTHRLRRGVLPCFVTSSRNSEWSSGEECSKVHGMGRNPTQNPLTS